MLKVGRATFTASCSLDLSLSDNTDLVVVASGKNLLSIFEIFTQGIVILFVVNIIALIRVEIFYFSRYSHGFI